MVASTAASSSSSSPLPMARSRRTRMATIHKLYTVILFLFFVERQVQGAAAAAAVANQLLQLLVPARYVVSRDAGKKKGKGKFTVEGTEKLTMTTRRTRWARPGQGQGGDQAPLGSIYDQARRCSKRLD